MIDHQPVLVTGASGFIGGHLVRRLIGRHCRVWCLVRDRVRAEGLRLSGAQVIAGDVTDRSTVGRVLSQSHAETVFHLAGLTKARHRDDFHRINAGAVEAVAAACASAAVPPALVVVSSLSAAGPCAANQVRQEHELPEPVSAYGRSKLAGEAAAAQHAGAMPISVVRPPIVFGPGDRAVLEILRPIARWGVHVLPGWRGRENRLSLIHVEDLLQGLLLVAEQGERLRVQAPPGQGVYFLAGQEDLTFVQLGQAIGQALGLKHPANFRVPGPLLKLAGIGGDLIARFRGNPGWINSDKMTEALAGSWTCSSAKARAQLGWSPATTLAARLHETVQWYRQAGWLQSTIGDAKNSPDTLKPS